MYCEEFNDCDLDNGKTPLRKKFNEIIKDLEENNSTSQGNIKLIKGDGNIEYFRAKLSDGDRLLFTRRKHNDKDAFVILEVILNHDYHKSKFLTNREKIRNIKIIGEEVPDTVEIEDAPQVSYLGKFITFSAKQKDIVKRVGKFELPLVISGSAGSGKTSVALESLKRIKEKLEGGKILYITKSKNLIKESKRLLEYEYYDETADEFKIAAPEEIDFLSLHEFLEKRAEDIKGKKPIDRSKFFSWFDEICKKDKFKEYKKDGDKIFEEFTAVIGGGGLLEEDRYTRLGDRQAVFPKEKRGNIYGLFEEYKKFIEKDSEYYDPNLVAYKCIIEGMYDAIVVDEVQDLTESTLGLILKSLKDESKSNFLLCGDVNQVIHPNFFSLSKLKSFLHKNTADKEPSVYTLEKNYRNSQQVIEIANRILHLKNYCFASEDKLTAEEKRNFFMASDTKSIGNANFITDNKKEEIAKKVSNSKNWAVLVLDDKDKESASDSFETPLVFNIHEAKGLEFDNVILYKFMSNPAYNRMWNVVCPDKKKDRVENAISQVRNSYEKRDVNTSRNKNKEDKSFEEFKFYMNALYVGVSRAIDGVYVIGNEKKCNLLKVMKPEGGKIINIEDIKKEESTPEEWRDMALELIDEGNIEQAKNIAVKKLLGKKEYIKKIVDVLKAQGYGKEAEEIQFSLGKEDKLEQTKESFSELKTENSTSQSPQKCSMGESMIPTRKARKRKNKKYKAKQDPNKDQEKEPLEKSKELKRMIRVAKLEKLKKMDISQYNGQELKLAPNSSNLYSLNKLAIKHKIVPKRTDSFEEKDDASLHVVVQRGHTALVKSFLLSGVDVNARIKDRVPLYLAAEGGYLDIAQLLLDKDANVNAATNEGSTPLHVAAYNGHDKVVKLLLDKDANVNARTQGGITPLHMAAEKGHDDIVRLFLDNGADVNAKSEKDFTPLHVAAGGGYLDIAQLLLEHRADVNARTQEGSTPLHGAVQNDHYDIVKLLLEHEADVNARTQGGIAPLHVAAGKGHKCIIELLLKHGADVNAKSEKGFTPLHVAVQEDKKNVVELLLEHGADVNAKSEKDFTLLAMALRHGHPKVVDLLLADPNINVDCVDIKLVTAKKEDKRKLIVKRLQDSNLFEKVKEAAGEKDIGKLGELLKEIEKLLKLKNEYGFKPSLNYSPDGNDENTTIKVAIKAGGKLLQLLYDYAKKHINKDTEIFKQLKHAKENSQPKSDASNVSVSCPFDSSSKLFV